MTVALIPTISFLCHRSPFSLFVNNSTRKPYSCFCCLRLPMPPSTIVVEYAKSKRSTCKTCSSAIPANALRLGVVSRDAQRGFDMTRWHHLDCFSFDSVSVSSADSIRGFDSLKSYDQDALKKLIEKREQAKNRDEDNPIRDEQEITKKKKVKDKDKNIAVPEEQRTPKKVKPAESEYAKAEAGLAAPDITDKYKGSTLPPKWKAFHTVIFLEKDDGLQDASKIAAFDFDGCLAKTSVKRIGADAWSLMYPSVPDKLQKLYADGFKLVIFTNECNIDRWRNKRQTAVDSKIGRLNNFLKCVSVPMQHSPPPEKNSTSAICLEGTRSARSQVRKHSEIHDHQIIGGLSMQERDAQTTMKVPQTQHSTQPMSVCG